MKSIVLPMPVGFTPPQDGASQPFELTGKFLVVGEGLLALELAGAPLAGEAEPEDEDEAGETEAGEDEAGETEADGCCGAYRKGPEHQCPDCPKKGGGFIVAIERALAKR